MARADAPGRRRPRSAPGRRFRIPGVVFIAVGLTVLGVAGFFVVAPLLTLRAPEAGTERRVIVTMAGFTPSALRVPAGRATTVRLVNPDSPYHADGGGWHQFRIDRLGVDLRIPPRSERSVILPALAPGTYTFYCDVCCGGKENPAMRGVVEVAG